jgi:hypothetical protein
VFEEADFTDSSTWDRAITRALENHPQSLPGLPQKEGRERLRAMLWQMLADVTSAEIREGLRLDSVTRPRRLNELEFSFPVPHLSATGLNELLSQLGYAGPRLTFSRLEGYPGKRCRHRIDLDYQRAAIERPPRQTRCWLHLKGRPDANQDVAGLCSQEGVLKHCRIKRFAEPHYIGPQQGAACRTTGNGPRLQLNRRQILGPGIRIEFVIDSVAIADAADHRTRIAAEEFVNIHECLQAHQIAVKLDDVSAPGRLVKVVDVLGDDADARHQLLKPRNGGMALVWPGLAHRVGEMDVPVPDELGILPERVRRRDFGRIDFRPQALGPVAKGRDAAFGRHPCPREHHQMPDGAKTFL